MVAYKKCLGKGASVYQVALRIEKATHSVMIFRFAKNVGNVGASTVP